MCHFSKCVRRKFACSFPITPSGKKIKNVPKFYLIWQELGSESSIIQMTQQNESFSQVRKKECSPRTLTNISFEQNIPMSQGLVTLEASVLCFFCIYSFPLSASSLVSAETPSADESINRWKHLNFRKLIAMRSNVYQICKYQI